MSVDLVFPHSDALRKSNYCPSSEPGGSVQEEEIDPESSGQMRTKNSSVLPLFSDDRTSVIKNTVRIINTAVSTLKAFQESFDVVTII